MDSSVSGVGGEGRAEGEREAGAHEFGLEEYNPDRDDVDRISD